MRALICALLLSSVAGCAAVEAERPPVDVEMQNVDLHVSSDITLHVRHLRGQFVPQGQAAFPSLNDAGSYVVTLETGQIALDLASLHALLMRTLGEGGSNVDHLQLSIDRDGSLRQKGVIDKTIDIPFNVKATVEPTPDGRIRVVSRSVKGFGVPMKPVMKIFGVEMDDLVKVAPGRGITVDDNDLVIDPSMLLPPPSMRGRVTAVRIEGNSLVQTFGSGAERHLSPPPESRNYIYWRGGQLSFGKLTMNETDLELVDDDPRDPFDFSVEHWNEQLVAGYSKTTARRGLKAHMPDYNDLTQRRQPSRQRSTEKR
jgi:hypothetical protein